MKRLLCLLSSMNAGGAETFLMKVYRKLDRSRFQLDFCINEPEKNFYEDEILALGGRIYRIPAKSQDFQGYRRGLQQVVAENGCQYVLRITSSAMGFMDLQLAKKAGARVCIARSSNSSDGGSAKALVAHRLGRLLYGKYVDVKLAPSDLAAKYTFGNKAYEQGQVHILENAVDVDSLGYCPQARSALRKELGIGENARVVGHIGRLSAQKNHDFLLDIFSRICQADPAAVLLLVGKGELEPELRQKAQALGIADKVIFAGVRKDIPGCLSAMDVFLFPSLYEGMPNTIIEAQANGLRCILSDTITRQADITGLLTYLPLSASADTWAQKALEAEPARQDQKAAFVAAGYDIDTMVNRFTELVFKK